MCVGEQCRVCAYWCIWRPCNRRDKSIIWYKSIWIDKNNSSSPSNYEKTESGTIVNISSGAGRFGYPAGSAYVSTKFAVEGLSESMS